MSSDPTYDCIIVGSGTAGSTLARELARAGQRVLVLERGRYRPLKETVWTLASMFNEVRVADGLKDARVFAAGGSTAMYLAVMDRPAFEVFRRHGIDLAAAFEAVRRELPLAEMADALLSPQACRLRDAALAEGQAWTKHLMMIDQTRCDGHYRYEAKWKALAYLDDAVRAGATLHCGHRVERVLIEDGAAVGVECRVGSPLRSRTERYRARRVVLAAGSLASPPILRASGLAEITRDGFYIDPSLVLFGRVPGLEGRDSFAGTMGCTLDDGTRLQDACVHKLPFTMFMLQMLRPLRIRRYGEHLGIMIKAHDAVGGALSADGRYHKPLDAAVFERLRHGEAVARRILQRAGAEALFKTPVMTGGALGTVRIGVDVDAALQTRIRGLHVCDGSLIPADGRAAPTLTLLCLAKHLAAVLTDPPTTRRDEPVLAASAA